MNVRIQFEVSGAFCLWLAAGATFAAKVNALGDKPELKPSVEIEEDVYKYQSASNGAGPMWCSGSTCLVRIGEDVFASGLETLTNSKPLNNCRWNLYERAASVWKLRLADSGRTREPSPLAAFQNGRLFLSANPSLAAPDAYSGPARPEILDFDARDAKAPPKSVLPVWDGKPKFTEHSYRSLAADGARGELILFQNVDYSHAEWAFLDREGKWAAQGKLAWPEGRDYPKPGPIRVCYPDVALKNRAVHFCGVSDIVEPYPEWRAFKKELTGNEWDYDFRRLFYSWTPDIQKSPFSGWIEIASRDKTCGWISPGDLWVAPDGAAHVVWTERALDERLRAKFFPGEKQSHAMNYALIREGKIALRRTLVLAEEGGRPEYPSAPRFHVTSDNRLFVIFFSHGVDAAGKPMSENRLLEIHAEGEPGPVVRVPFKTPFTSYFTATVRAGSPASDFVELLGERQGAPLTIAYARVKLW